MIFFKKSLIAIITICLIALVFEMALRRTRFDVLRAGDNFGGYPRFHVVANKDRGFDNQKDYQRKMFYFSNGKHEIWTNSLGCFDNDTDPDDGYILLLGDSFTWGFCPFEKKWGSLLEKSLNKRVIKAGVTAYGTRQEISKAKEIINITKKVPSLIVLGYFMNDFTDDYLFPRYTVYKGYRIDNFKISDFQKGTILDYESESWKSVDNFLRFGDPNVSSADSRKEIVFWFKKNSTLFCLLVKVKDRLIANRQVTNSKSTTKNPIYSPYGVSSFICFGDVEHYPWLKNAWSEHLNNLKSLNDYAESIGSKLLVVLIPLKEQLYPNIPQFNPDEHPRFVAEKFESYPQDILQSYLHENRILFLDLKDSLKPYIKNRLAHVLDENELYWNDDIHWNERGNKLAGLLVTKHVIENKLMKFPAANSTLANIKTELGKESSIKN